MSLSTGEEDCLHLAREGERLLRIGDTQRGIQQMMEALRVGTDNLSTLSAIYSQLGNGYFSVGDYEKAYDYHRFDLDLARIIGNNEGEAKACGNIGNTLNQQGLWEDAALLANRQLNLYKNGNDKPGEARALYNLGNIHFAKGKALGRVAHSRSSSTKDAVPFPQEVEASLTQAVSYFESLCTLAASLGDKAALGRGLGSLGNAHYLLGHFNRAIAYHDQRLALAQEFGDKIAARRAHMNLGNAALFLPDYPLAIQHFNMALSLAKELGEKTAQAQALFALGSSKALLESHSEARDSFLLHLSLARDLNDVVGQARAAASLADAAIHLEQPSIAMYWTLLQARLSRSIGDEAGKSAASKLLEKLRDVEPDSSQDPDPVEIVEEEEAAYCRASMSRLEPYQAQSHPRPNKLSNDGGDMFAQILKGNQNRMVDQDVPPNLICNKENRRRQADAYRPGMSIFLSVSVCMWMIDEMCVS